MRFGGGDVARRLEADCLHRRPWDGKPRGYIQEIPAGCLVPLPLMAWTSPARAAVRDDHSVLGRVGATWMLFPIHGGEVSRFQRSSLEISRFNGATTADTCIRSTTYGGPGRQPLMSFAWSSRLAPGCSGKRSRRRTPWESKTWEKPWSITPDAQSYCYSYMRRLGDLFVVDGLK